MNFSQQKWRHLNTLAELSRIEQRKNRHDIAQKTGSTGRHGGKFAKSLFYDSIFLQKPLIFALGVLNWSLDYREILSFLLKSGEFRNFPMLTDKNKEMSKKRKASDTSL